MSKLMENHINDLELQIAQLETAVKCYIVDIDIQKQKNKILQNKINKAIEYITHEWFKREQIGISHLSFSYDELQHILDILRGKENADRNI